MSFGNDMAFPTDPIHTPNNTIQCGLTKREYFAALIMPRIVGANWTDERSFDDCARRAALAADALLVELTK